MTSYQQLTAGDDEDDHDGTPLREVKDSGASRRTVSSGISAAVAKYRSSTSQSSAAAPSSTSGSTATTASPAVIITIDAGNKSDSVSSDLQSQHSLGIATPTSPAAAARNNNNNNTNNNNGRSDISTHNNGRHKRTRSTKSSRSRRRGSDSDSDGVEMRAAFSLDNNHEYEKAQEALMSFRPGSHQYIPYDQADQQGYDSSDDDNDDDDGWGESPLTSSHPSTAVNGTTATATNKGDDPQGALVASQATSVNPLNRSRSKRRVTIVTASDGTATEVLGKRKPTRKQIREMEHCVKEIARALLSVGLPIHVVQFYCLVIGAQFGAKVNFMCIANCMWIQFGSDDHCHMIRCQEDLSLSKMVGCYHVCEDIVREKCDLPAGLARVAAIYNRKALFPSWYKIPAYAMLSAASAPLFNGGAYEVLVSLLIGTVVGLLGRFTAKNVYMDRGADLIAALMATLTTVLIHDWVYPVDIMACTFAGIVWCLPGLKLVLAMTDLSTGQPVTGTVKFMQTILVCINLGLGIVAGLAARRTEKFVPVNTHAVWIDVIAVLLAAFPLLILLDGMPGHLLQLSIGSIAAFSVSAITSTLVTTVGFGSCAGAFCCGILSNLYSRRTRHPAIEFSLFCILMLLPGSLGVRSILAKDAVGTVEFFVQMISVAMAIVTGLFAANLVVRPSRQL